MGFTPDAAIELWNKLVYSLVGGTMPDVENITGVRIVDKTTIGKESDYNIKIEIWVKHNKQNDEYVRNIRELVGVDKISKDEIKFLQHTSPPK